jgi:hypothetical protein
VLGLTEVVPLVPFPATTVAGTSVPSASVSFATTSIGTVPPSATVSASALATGGSFTAVTVIVTVAGLLVAPWSSSTV